MNTIAANFTKAMDDVHGFLEISAEVIQLPKKSITTTKSSTAFVLAAKKLRREVLGTHRIDIVAYDGAFLHVCAEFELTIRALVDRYVERAIAKCPEYHNLPSEIRNWYPKGCANLILNIQQVKFSHLTVNDVVTSLASSARNVSAGILPDAFSYNDNNFKPSVVEDCFNRIAINKIWQKLSREGDLQTNLGTSNRSTTEEIAKIRLQTVIDRRNSIIHRGKTSYTSSRSEVLDSVDYLNQLVKCLAAIMERNLAAL
jgi:hypothetical protein